MDKRNCAIPLSLSGNFSSRQYYCFILHYLVVFLLVASSFEYKSIEQFI